MFAQYNGAVNIQAFHHSQQDDRNNQRIMQSSWEIALADEKCVLWLEATRSLSHILTW